MTEYRVWPDGTVQEACETPYRWMSDDYMTVWVLDEDDALAKSIECKSQSLGALKGPTP